MRNGALMLVSCDKCGRDELLEMERTGETWGDYTINTQLRDLGWYAVENVHYCPDCKPDIKRVIETGPLSC